MRTIARGIQSKEYEKELKRKSRELLILRMKIFIEEYRRNKLGLLGVFILVTYVVLAIVGPYISPADPMLDMDLADRIVPPEWVAIFGGEFARLPPTLYWKIVEEVLNHDNSVSIECDDFLVVSINDESLTLNLKSRDNIPSVGVLRITKTFQYNYRPPRTFFVYIRGAKEKGYVTYLKIYVEKPDGETLLLWDCRRLNPYFNALFEKGGLITICTREMKYIDWFAEQYELVSDPFLICSTVFDTNGTYKLVFEFKLVGINRIARSDKNLNFRLIMLDFKILGLRYGILGTDNWGRDVFAQLVNGIWVSLTIGVVASIIGSLISAFLGITAVLMGGVVDEVIMRTADIMMILPRLPLLLVLMAVLKGDIWTVIILLAIIYAPSGARGVRAFVLTYINEPFIEAAKARGAGFFRMVFRHVFPPLLPIIYANMARSAPAAITLEAELSYLGIATDPYRMTWGKMLSFAQASGALSRWAWWWIFPPGFSIMLVSLSFVLIGHALDEIMNPRLKRRR